MIIIPAIDIRGGRCVRLVQGDYARETVFGKDPLAMARHWVALGAQMLHVVDLDGAKDRRPVNDAVMRRIIAECGAPVQVAGGMHDLATVDAWVAAGAARVVIGTLAVEAPDIVAAAAAQHGERIALAVDARDGRVATRGWLETSDVSVDAFIRTMAARGVGHFIYTDISRDGTMAHPDFAHVQPIVDAVREATATPAGQPAPLIYSGGITSTDDIVEVARYELEGVISGRALYDGSIDLRDAQRALTGGAGAAS